MLPEPPQSLGRLFVGRITSGFSAKERQWRYRRGEFWQDYVRILRERTPVALPERRIPAGLRPDSPRKNTSGVIAEENSGRVRGCG